MKKMNVFAALAFVVAMGAAFISKADVLKLNTSGFYWDAANNKCQSAQSSFTCTTSGSVACKDDGNGGPNTHELHNTNSGVDPCGTLLQHN